MAITISRQGHSIMPAAQTDAGRLEQELADPILPDPSRAARFASPTGRMTTAISDGESRASLTRLAEEQAAVRRVATLVAHGTLPEEVFAVVVEEVVQLLRADLAIMGRYDADGTVTSVARSGGADDHLPVGSRRKLGGDNLGTIVFETGLPARADHYRDRASGPIGSAVHEAGIRSSVAAPIRVEGRLWGLIAAGASGEEPLPGDTEARLASFTDLLATAVANADSRAALARLAEEQAALRRIATLVAHGMRQDDLFAVVTAEVGRLLPAEYAHLGRYEPDGTLVVVGTWDDGAGTHLPVGRRQGVGGRNLATSVFETGRSARMDDYASASGPLGIAAHERGIRSAVGTPIIVEGRVWGVAIAGVRSEQPLAEEAEARLGSFTDLVATAIANGESRSALAASRARLVAAGDESRRQIERDLHDGAQQRLVHAVIMLKLARRALSDGYANAGELMAEALSHAEQAQVELRELAHGILPAALTRGGLRAGVESLVSRVSLPVNVDVSVARLPAGVEATAYFVISEALTNAVKHAGADRADVLARFEDGELRVEVRDGGVGGAQGGDGTGLGSLRDRVSALDGRFELDSPPGDGTRVCAFLPVSDQSELAAASRR
jgi:signal transduction histidine kinase